MTDAVAHQISERLSGELVEDVQDLDLAARRGHVEPIIQRPNAVPAFGSEEAGGCIGVACTPALAPPRAAESDDRLGSALDRLVASWAEIAVSHAAVRYLEDHSGHVATVAGIEGAWGLGDTEEEALDELRSVLVGWACLKLEDGDDDIPNMEGIHLVVKR